MVFQLPYAPYAEGYRTAREVEWSHLNYECIRGLFHTNRLRWSSPAMKGREADRWQARLLTEPPEQAVAESNRPASAGSASIATVTTTAPSRSSPNSVGSLAPNRQESPDQRFAFFALPRTNPPAEEAGSK